MDDSKRERVFSFSEDAFIETLKASSLRFTQVSQKKENDTKLIANLNLVLD